MSKIEYHFDTCKWHENPMECRNESDFVLFIFFVWFVNDVIIKDKIPELSPYSLYSYNLVPGAHNDNKPHRILRTNFNLFRLGTRWKHLFYRCDKFFFSSCRNLQIIIFLKEFSTIYFVFSDRSFFGLCVLVRYTVYSFEFYAHGCRLICPCQFNAVK